MGLCVERVSHEGRAARLLRVVWACTLASMVACMVACTGSISGLDDPAARDNAAAGSSASTSGQAGASGASAGQGGSAANGASGGGAGDAANPLSFQPPPALLRRLTRAQYQNSVRQLLGDLTLTTQLEADALIHGSVSVGTAHSTLSPHATEQYENAAFELAAQAITPEHRAALVSCAPSAVLDRECTQEFVQSFGRRVFRRPLETSEVDRYVALAENAAQELGDFWSGIEFALAGMLQSPRFLFRAELGEVDPAVPERFRYDGYDMAARLSFLFLDTTPDAMLLDAAESGELLSAAGVRDHAERLSEDPRARAALATFHAERLGLEELEALSKDGELFPGTDAALASAMREDILRTIEQITVGDEGDYRDVFDTRLVFADDRLAAIYGVDGSGTSMSQLELPEDSLRLGLLGKPGILAMMAHTRETSPTRRGKFVRERILCQTISAPPPGVVTVLPVPNPDAPTMRDRLKTHAVEPSCAGCHVRTDPIGLAFEHFDAIGAYRPDDDGHAIDPSGELDGEAFADARELSLLVRDRPDAAECVVRQLYRYAGAHVETGGEASVIRALAERFVALSYRLPDLLIDVATSDGFRYAGAGAQP